MGDLLNVLYVDDEPLLKMAFVETLKQHGYYARGAGGGQEALDMIKDETPDIIILDIMMKPMDGWEALLQIRNILECKSIPVIMQTGKSLTIRDVLKYGDLFDDYMIKPVRLPDLIRAIESVLARNESIRKDFERAINKGVAEKDATELADLMKKVLVYKRLIEVLGRIYPITKDGKIESDSEIPELYEFVRRYNSSSEKCEELSRHLNS